MSKTEKNEQTSTQEEKDSVRHDKAVDLLLFVAYISCMALGGFLLGIRDILKG